jgi:hypothetical protein
MPAAGGNQFIESPSGLPANARGVNREIGVFFKELYLVNLMADVDFDGDKSIDCKESERRPLLECELRASFFTLSLLRISMREHVC